MLSTLAYGHTFISQPVTRNLNSQDVFTTTKGGYKDASCGNGKDQANEPVTTLKRGEKLPVKWARNNHSGGFMRYSIASFENSDVYSDYKVGNVYAGIFDDPKRIFHYECAEKVCKSGKPDNPTGPDPNPAFMSNVCEGDLTLPNWVPNGKFTIQGIWYGTGHSKQDIFRGQTFFTSCFEIYVVDGGEPLDPKMKEYTEYVKGTDIKLDSAGQCTSKATFTPGDVNGTEGCKWFTATKGTVYGCSNDECFCEGKSDDEDCYERGPPPEYCGSGTTPPAAPSKPSPPAAPSKPSPPAVPSKPSPPAVPYKSNKKSKPKQNPNKCKPKHFRSQ
eukprot:NODE_202_length_14999_cov_0.270067.p6 type:complete len:331 gc:universal NODE_202_length_14999_cov_0.270067:2419-3411(+)